MDSRKGLGTRTGPKVGRIVVDLARRIPTGATAAVLNVTVTGAAGRGHLVAYPDGTAKPGTSNVNFVKGRTQANEAVVALPSNRRIALTVAGASTHVIVDVVGYFTEQGDPRALGHLVTRAPVRVLDSRSAPLNTGTTPGRKAGGVVLDLRGRIPSGATSVALNVAVTGPELAGHVVAYATGTSRPGTSNVNFAKGQTQANEVITRVGTGADAGRVTLFVAGSRTHLVVDLIGAIIPGAADAAQLYAALDEPQRVMDSRKGTGTTAGRKKGDLVLTLPRGLVPAHATGLVLNVTTTDAREPGYVTVFRAGSRQPRTSNVNFVPGLTQANEVITGMNGSGQVALRVTGLSHAVVDVVGYLFDGS